jgi:hypothetical protein
MVENIKLIGTLYVGPYIVVDWGLLTWKRLGEPFDYVGYGFNGNT